jgi:hypothetical protein
MHWADCVILITHMSARGSGRITVRKARLGAEDARLDREYWERIPPADRVLETWRLSLELWRWKGWDRDESGLCRTVARVIRG